MAEASPMPGRAAISSAATSLTPCHLNTSRINSRMLPQYFCIE